MSVKELRPLATNFARVAGYNFRYAPPQSDYSKLTLLLDEVDHLLLAAQEAIKMARSFASNTELSDDQRGWLTSLSERIDSYGR